MTNSPVARPGRRDDCSETFEKSSTIGVAEGSIIAAIIVTQMPRYQPNEPRSVPGPASIPRIRATTITQAANVTPRNPVTTPGRSARAVIVVSLELMWRGVSTIHRVTQWRRALRRVTSLPRMRYETVKLPNMMLSCASQ